MKTPLDIDSQYLEADKDYAWKDTISMDWTPVPADTHPHFIQPRHKLLGNIITFTHNRKDSAKLYLCWRDKRPRLPDVSTEQQLAEVRNNLFGELSEIGGDGFMGITTYIGTEKPYMPPKRRMEYRDGEYVLNDE